VHLGCSLEDGDGVAENKAEALRTAVEQGYTEAFNRLGYMFDSGEGFVRDSAEVVII